MSVFLVFRYLLCRIAPAACGVLPAIACAHAAIIDDGRTAPTPAQMQRVLPALQIPFEANHGQYDRQVAFAANTFAGTLFVTHDGELVYALPPTGNEKAGLALIERLEDSAALRPQGMTAAPTKISRFHGDVAVSAISAWRRITLGEAWPGIHVEIAAYGNNAEKLFTVAPGADPRRIQIAVSARKERKTLRLGDDGSLIVATGQGEVAFTAPVAFQQQAGKRTEVPVRYALFGEDHYGFEVGEYDPSLPLVIDPLLQSTYLEGSSTGRITAVSVDHHGNVVVTGYTSSPDFPGTAGGAQEGYVGNATDEYYDVDAFVALLSGDLSSLLQTTYLGGMGGDYPTAIAVDRNGDVLVAGYTVAVNLMTNDFPGVAGGAQSVYGGFYSDGFIALLSGDLTVLKQATYLGGPGRDYIRALALTDDGSIVVAGDTGSTFPGTAAGAIETFDHGGHKGFVSLLSSDLKRLIQSTYMGGAGLDYVNAIALAGNGDVLVAGSSDSAFIPHRFPGMTGGAQSNMGGLADGFIARLSADLTRLIQATFLGGTQDDSICSIVIDGNGGVLAAGTTWWTNTNGGIPGTAGGAQPAPNGGHNGFVALLSEDLTTLVRASYLSGANTPSSGAPYLGTLINALALDHSGGVLVAGYTNATDLPAVSEGAQAVSAGAGEGFVALFSSDLTSLTQTTYFGGAGEEEILAMAPDGNGNVIVAGFTASVDLPSSIGGLPAAVPGGEAGFIARLTGDLRAAPRPAPPGLPSATSLMAVPAISQGMLLLLMTMLGLIGCGVLGRPRL